MSTRKSNQRRNTMKNLLVCHSRIIVRNVTMAPDHVVLIFEDGTEIPIPSKYVMLEGFLVEWP